MNILHVIPSIAEESSGPSYSVSRLVESLLEAGNSTELVALDWYPNACKPKFLRTFPFGFGPKSLGRSPAMRRWIQTEAKKKRIHLLHNHGMWQANSIFSATIAARYRIPFVSSPRGALSTWAMKHGSKLKRILWPFLQRPALNKSACFHATSTSELQDIRRLGFPQPVAVIPNGIDVPPIEYIPKSQPRTLLFLGRIHPVKGLDLLLPAWKVLEPNFPEWQLVVAGSDSSYEGNTGYTEQMRNLANTLQLTRVTFCGEVNGPDKLKLLRKSELFVLPSYSENFGVAVAEALAAGTPAVVSKGAPWEGLANYDAGWHVETSSEGLVEALSHAMKLNPHSLQQMGENGRKWMLETHSWRRIATMMSSAYSWLLDPTSERPEFISVRETGE